MGIQSVQFSRTLRVGAGTGDGSTSGNAGSSALSVKQRTGTTTDGLYWVKPPSGPARQVWCDMNTAGGGWMLVARTHPSASPSSGNWGWRNSSIFGGATTYGAGYCLDLLNFYNTGFKFYDYIFGNQLTDNSNAWGPFIYMVSLSDPDSLMTSDIQQSGVYYQTLKYDTNVYGSTGFPGMQGAIGYAASSTAGNFYYMRDCCGFAGFGVYPTGMVTTYCSSPDPAFYAGPWCNGATLSGNNWVQGGSSSATNTGGTSQCMIMVR